jgi:hypothetical protein
MISFFYAVQYILVPSSVFFVVASVCYLVCLYAKYKIVKNIKNNICSLPIATGYFNVFSRKKLTLLQTNQRLNMELDLQSLFMGSMCPAVLIG